MGWKSGKSLHGEDWLKLAGVVGAAAAPFALPALGLGGAAAAGVEGAAALGGAGELASVGATGGTMLGESALAQSGLLAEPSMSASVLQGLGSMSPEQAQILAMQNEGLGFGADKLTLDSAATAGKGGWSTPYGGLKSLNVGKGMKVASSVNALSSALQPPQPRAPAPPRQPQMPTGSFMDAITPRERIPQPGDPDYPAYLDFIRRRNRGY